MQRAKDQFRPLDNLYSDEDLNVEKLSGGNYKEKMYGYLYMLDGDMINFDDDLEDNSNVLNPIEYLDVAATIDFEYLTFNNMRESK